MYVYILICIWLLLKILFEEDVLWLMFLTVGPPITRVILGDETYFLSCRDSIPQELLDRAFRTIPGYNIQQGHAGMSQVKVSTVKTYCWWLN